MKKYYFVVFCCLNAFRFLAQNDPVILTTEKDVQSRTWHGRSNFYSDRVIFLKKALVTDGKSEIRFTKNGKIIFCDTLTERRPYFTGNGEERFLEPGRHCDSTSTKYQIKKNILHVTQDGTYHYYFRMEIVRTGNLELIVTEPETFFNN